MLRGEKHTIEVENLNLRKTVLASGMQLNHIPYVPDTDFYLLFYILFSVIAILAIIFIIGTILTLKYNSHRRLIGKIFVAIGIIEIIPLIFLAVRAILPTHFTILAILGLITLTGGLASIKQVKSHWMFFLIMAAIILIIWTVDFFFIY